MEIDEDEIRERINRQKELIQTMERRKHSLEVQSARTGYNTAPEITNEIADLTEKIAMHENEIARLRVRIGELEKIKAQQNALIRMKEALADTRYKDGTRTISRLATIAAITEDEARDILRGDPEVEFVRKRATGELMARLKSK